MTSIPSTLDSPIRLTIPPELARLEALNDSLDAALRQRGVDADVRADVRLIIEEWACNAITHGEADGADGKEMQIDIDIKDGLLHLRFSDGGPPFDPRSVSDPDLDAHILDRPVGGLGLYLIRQLAEQLEYQRSGHRNLLHVSLRIPNKEP